MLLRQNELSATEAAELRELAGGGGGFALVDGETQSPRCPKCQRLGQFIMAAGGPVWGCQCAEHKLPETIPGRALVGNWRAHEIAKGARAGAAISNAAAGASRQASGDASAKPRKLRGGIGR